MIANNDRTAFFDFQARNRRATWRISAVCAAVIGGAGVVAAAGFIVNLVLVLFALVFFPSILLVGLGFLAGVFPATTSLRDPLLGAATFTMRGLSFVTTWPDVVEEMAIAAGIRPPSVRLLDANAVNAAAVGTAPTDSYVVVARRLLDEFDRDETQGILAHLVGSIGNADLRGAAQIHAMLYVLELMTVVVLAPFASYPRRVARQWLAFPITARFRSSEKRAERARALITLLEAHRAKMPTSENHLDDAQEGDPYFGRIGRVLVRIAPPLLALIFFAKAATGFMLIFASAPVALLWRSRRYLADATGVQLTRNPTGLYLALSHLGKCGAIIPGSEAVSHLFIVAPEKAAGAPDSFTTREGLLMGMYPSLAHRLSRLVRMGAVPPA